MENTSHLTEDQLQEYFDDSCELAEKTIIASHLQYCTTCTEEFERIKSIDRILKYEYMVAPLSINLSERVADMVFKEEKKPADISDKLLLILLAIVCLSGTFYYLRHFIVNSSVVIALLLLLPVILYIMISYKEIKILNHKFYSDGIN